MNRSSAVWKQHRGEEEADDHPRNVLLFHLQFARAKLVYDFLTMWNFRSPRGEVLSEELTFLSACQGGEDLLCEQLIV